MMRPFPPVHLWLAGCLTCALPARAADQPPFSQVLADPASWSAPGFLEQFKHDPADEGAPVAQARLQPAQEVFGLQPQTVSVTLAHGVVHSISVVFLDAGIFFGFQNSSLPKGESFDQGKARFDQDFSQAKQKVLAGLQKLGGVPSPEVALSPRGGLKLKGAIIHCGGSVARLISHEHQLLMVTFFRTDAAARSLVAVPLFDRKARPEAFSSLSSFAPRNANASPEHRIKPVPMIIQGNRGYCGVATLAMAGQALGLQPGAEELAVANDFKYGQETNPDIRDMFAQIAREAGVRAQRQNKFDQGLMRTSIDQGLPVVVFRWWSEERDYIHSVYSARIARGEKAELPAASIDDRRTWPGKNAPAHASIINGYRDDRHEAIFTESWGPQSRNRRMRYEEMDATVYYAVFFTK